jgi:hypothetical protein
MNNENKVEEYTLLNRKRMEKEYTHKFNSPFWNDFRSKNVILSKNKLFKLLKIMKSLKKEHNKINITNSTITLSDEEHTQQNELSVNKLNQKIHFIESLINEEAVDKMIDRYSARLVKLVLSNKIVKEEVTEVETKD